MNRSEGASMKECNFYDDNHCMLAPQNKCSEIHIDYCYYKQLTQAKKENERLRESNKTLIDDTAKAIENYDKLQQDLKAIKQKYDNDRKRHLENYKKYKQKYKQRGVTINCLNINLANYDLYTKRLEQDLKVAKQALCYFLNHYDLKTQTKMQLAENFYYIAKKTQSEISDKDTTDIQEEVGYSKADVFDEYFG